MVDFPTNIPLDDWADDASDGFRSFVKELGDPFKAAQQSLGDIVQGTVQGAATGIGQASDALRGGLGLDSMDTPLPPKWPVSISGDHPQEQQPTQAAAVSGDWVVAFDFDKPYDRPFNSDIPRHRGVDLQLRGQPDGGRGSTYTAFAPGTVTAITNDPHGGQGIIVQTDDGLYHRYFHNDAVLVKQGQRVDPSTPLGVLGATGTEGFPHLHFEVSRGINGDPMGQTIDPRPFMQGGGQATPRQRGFANAADAMQGAQVQDPNPLVNYAREAAKRAGIDPDLFVRQIQQESGFNPNAVSSAGARGVAQIMPQYHPGVDPSDPYASLDYAANLMASHIKQYGDVRKALVAYNGGGGAVAQYEAGTPYGESRAYLDRILGGGQGARPTQPDHDHAHTESPLLSDETLRQLGFTAPDTVKKEADPAEGFRSFVSGLGDPFKAAAEQIGQAFGRQSGAPETSFDQIGQAPETSFDQVGQPLGPPTPGQVIRSVESVLPGVAQRAGNLFRFGLTPEEFGLTAVGGIGDLAANSGSAMELFGLPDQGKAVREYGEALQAQVPRAAKVYQGEEYLLDPDWWRDSVARSGVMMAPIMALSVLAGWGAAAVGTLAGMGTVGTSILAALGGGTASRAMESALEAGGSYADMLARGASKEEAERAGRETFTGNMALAGTDVAQFALQFTRLPSRVRGPLVRGVVERLGPVGVGMLKVLGVGTLEGAEELAQEAISRAAKRDPITWDSQMRQAGAAGFIMGGGMAVGTEVGGRLVEGVEASRPSEPNAPSGGMRLQPSYAGAPSGIATGSVVTRGGEPPSVARMSVGGSDDISRVGEAGKAIVDNMYAAMWDKIVKGDLTEAGQPSASMQVGRMLYDAGVAKGPDDLRAPLQELTRVREGKTGQAFQDAVRDVVEKYTRGHGQPKYDYSSTQVNLEPVVAQGVKALAARIPDADLAKDGREDQPHITVKYGLHTNDVAEVQKVLADERTIIANLGRTSVFPAAETGGEYDVVKVDVESADLHRLNKKLAEALPSTDTHPTYTPHVTLAYVKPGTGQKYAGDASLVGRVVEIDRIAFSDRNGNQVDVPLGGMAGPESRISEASSERTSPPSTDDIQTLRVGDTFKWGATYRIEAVDGKDVLVLPLDREGSARRIGRAELEQRRGIRVEGEGTDTPSAASEQVPLKVGDTFEHKGRRYRMTDVAHDGYSVRSLDLTGRIPISRSWGSVEAFERETGRTVERPTPPDHDFKVGDRVRDKQSDREGKVVDTSPGRDRAARVLFPQQQAAWWMSADSIYRVDDQRNTESPQPDETGVESASEGNATHAVRPTERRGTGGADSPLLAGEGPRDGQAPDGGGDARDGVARTGADDDRVLPRPAEPPEAPAARRVGHGDEGARLHDLEGEPDRESPASSLSRPQPSSGRDYLYAADEQLPTTPAARFDANLRAIETLRQIEAEGRWASPEEQRILARYSGFGDSAFEHAFRYQGGDAPSWDTKADAATVERGKKLRALVSDAEWDAIAKSRLNAFYTSPEIIKGMWSALERMGLGNLDRIRVLEPSAGAGRFLGFQPADLAARSQRTAVELDTLTGGILRQLYQGAEVHVMGFEEAPLPPTYDVAISNVPFGDYPIVDREYLKPERRFLSRQVHNYFFAKALDKVRPGGVVAFVTSHFTMDAQKARPVREYLAKHAELLGAIRLPRGAFPDTQVVTDIIFLRKRQPDDELPRGKDGAAQYPDWVESVERRARPDGASSYDMEQRYFLNRYFADHPEMALGRHAVLKHGQYGNNEYGLVKAEGDLAEQIEKAIANLPERAITPAPRQESDVHSYAPDIDRGAKPGAYVVKDGVLLVRQKDGKLAEAGANYQKYRARIVEMLRVRDAAREVLRAQLDGQGDATLAEAQAELNRAYDTYVKVYGPLNERTNRSLMATDPDATFLRALERWGDDAEARVKAKQPFGAKEIARLKMPIFSQRVIREAKAVDHVDNPVDALTVVLNEHGRLHWGRMAELTGQSEQALQESLFEQRMVFKNPEGDWETADQYLSGDVRAKLRAAEKAAASDDTYDAHVEALKAVQPADLKPSEIDAMLGAPWIPGEDIEAFAGHLVDARLYGRNREPMFKYQRQLGEWRMPHRMLDVQTNSARNLNQWGTRDKPALELLLLGLNNKTPEVWAEGPIGMDGKPTRVKDPEATLAAQDKLEQIQIEFKKWLWADQERAERLAAYYNEHFNNLVSRQYDGSHLTFPGLNPEFTPHAHQASAVWRVLQDGVALLAHEVGFGKTLAMQAAAMELRRLGLATKPVFVVPKPLVEQFAQMFQRHYPAATILVPGPDDFTKDKRQELLARIATGEWDGVILSGEQFTKIGVRPETEKRYIDEEIEAYEAALHAEIDARAERGERRGQSDGEKAITKALVRLQAKRAELLEKLKDRRDDIAFEDLGVDALFTDEADLYKNLPFPTRRTRVKGLPSSSKTQRTPDMLMKTRLIMDRTNGRGVVFATGTPVANTMAELWIMMRYLMPKRLRELGLDHFDAWAGMFGVTQIAFEADVGGRFRPTTRFSKFVNVPELSRLFQSVADIRRSSELPEMEQLKPRIVGGKKPGQSITVVSPSSPALKSYMAGIVDRIKNLSGMPEKGGDNMLKIAGDARKASLDIRMAVPGAPEDPDGKINKLVGNVVELWDATRADRGTQLVFLDLGTPKATDEAKLDTAETAEDLNAETETAEEQSALTEVYALIKRKLVAAGIPADEVRFIHEAKKAEERTALSRAVNSGKVRVLLGSTGKMGAGLNVQERLAALHHLDAPWRPRDIEQRNGRGHRPGNLVFGPVMAEDGKGVAEEGKGIRIYRYVTELPSFDTFMWQALEAKARAIESIMRRNATDRSLEDADSPVISYAEAKALSTGDPDVMRRVMLNVDVMKLNALKGSHEDAVFEARGAVARLPREIARLREQIEAAEAYEKLAEAHPAEPFSITLAGKAYTERAAARDVLRNEMANTVPWSETHKEFARFRGFSIRGRMGKQERDGTPYLAMWAVHPDLSDDANRSIDDYALFRVAADEITAAGVLQRIENEIKSFAVGPAWRKESLRRTERDLKSYRERVEQPFEHAERLERAQREMAIIDLKLSEPAGVQPTQADESFYRDHLAQELGKADSPSAIAQRVTAFQVANGRWHEAWWDGVREEVWRAYDRLDGVEPGEGWRPSKAKVEEESEDIPEPEAVAPPAPKAVNSEVNSVSEPEAETPREIAPEIAPVQSDAGNVSPPAPETYTNVESAAPEELTVGDVVAVLDGPMQGLELTVQEVKTTRKGRKVVSGTDEGGRKVVVPVDQVEALEAAPAQLSLFDEPTPAAERTEKGAETRTETEKGAETRSEQPAPAPTVTVEQFRDELRHGGSITFPAGTREGDARRVRNEAQRQGLALYTPIRNADGSTSYTVKEIGRAGEKVPAPQQPVDDIQTSEADVQEPAEESPEAVKARLEETRQYFDELFDGLEDEGPPEPPEPPDKPPSPPSGGGEPPPEPPDDGGSSFVHVRGYGYAEEMEARAEKTLREHAKADKQFKRVRVEDVHRAARILSGDPEMEKKVRSWAEDLDTRGLAEESDAGRILAVTRLLEAEAAYKRLVALQQGGEASDAAKIAAAQATLEAATETADVALRGSRRLSESIGRALRQHRYVVQAAATQKTARKLEVLSDRAEAAAEVLEKAEQGEDLSASEQDTLRDAADAIEAGLLLLVEDGGEVVSAAAEIQQGIVEQRRRDEAEATQAAMKEMAKEERKRPLADILRERDEVLAKADALSRQVEQLRERVDSQAGSLAMKLPSQMGRSQWERFGVPNPPPPTLHYADGSGVPKTVSLQGITDAAIKEILDRVRKDLGWKPGDELDWQSVDVAAIVVPAIKDNPRGAKGSSLVTELDRLHEAEDALRTAMFEARRLDKLADAAHAREAIERRKTESGLSQQAEAALGKAPDTRELMEELVGVMRRQEEARIRQEWETVGRLEESARALLAQIDATLEEQMRQAAGKERAPLTQEQIDKRLAGTALGKLRREIAARLDVDTEQWDAFSETVAQRLKRLGEKHGVEKRSTLEDLAQRLVQLNQERTEAIRQNTWGEVGQIEGRREMVLAELHERIVEQERKVAAKPKLEADPHEAERAAAREVLRDLARRTRLELRYGPPTALGSAMGFTNLKDEQAYLDKLDKAAQRAFERTELADLAAELRRLADLGRGAYRGTAVLPGMDLTRRKLDAVGAAGKARADALREGLFKQGVLRYVAKGTADERLDDLVAALATLRRPEDLGALLRVMRQPTLWDYVREWSVINMLSSPMTWGLTGVNMMSNIVQVSGQVLWTMPMEALHDHVRHGGANARLGDVKVAVRGMGKARKEATTLAKEILSTGSTTDSLRRAAELGDLSAVRREYLSELPGAAGFLGKVGHMLSTRPLEAADVFLGHTLYQGMVAALAAREARKIARIVGQVQAVQVRPGVYQVEAADHAGIEFGMSLDETRAFARKHAWARGLEETEIARRVLAHIWDYEHILQEAGKIEDYALLRTDLPRAVQALNMLRTIPPKYLAPTNAREQGELAGRMAVAFAAHSMLPFVRVPFNWLRQGISYSAVGAVWHGTELAAEKNPKAQMLLFSKVAAGTVLTLIGMALMMSNNLTGDGPGEDEKRKMWLLTHHPNSVRILGKWFSYDGTPWAIPLGTIANFGEEYAAVMERAQDKPLAHKMSDALPAAIGAGLARGVAGGVARQSFLRDVGTVFEIMSGRGDASALMANQVTRYLPVANSMANFLAQMGDSVQREPKTFGERVLARIPGLRGETPERQDKLGRPVPNERGEALVDYSQGRPLPTFKGILEAFTPGRPGTPPGLNSPTIKEFERLGVNIPDPPDQLRNMPLTPEERREYQTIRGAKLAAVLDPLVNSQAWGRQGPDVQQKLLKGALSRTHREAEAELLLKIGERAGPNTLELRLLEGALTKLSGGRRILADPRYQGLSIDGKRKTLERLMERPELLLGQSG